MDNARIHHCVGIMELIDRFGEFFLLIISISDFMTVILKVFALCTCLLTRRTSIPLKRLSRRSRHGSAETTMFFQPVMAFCMTCAKHSISLLPKTQRAIFDMQAISNCTVCMSRFFFVIVCTVIGPLSDA